MIIEGHSSQMRRRILREQGGKQGGDFDETQGENML